VGVDGRASASLPDRTISYPPIPAKKGALSGGFSRDAPESVWRYYPPDPPYNKGGFVSVPGKDWWAIEDLNL